MSQPVSAITRRPADIVRTTPVSRAANGICYARAGEVAISDADLDRMIAAVPVAAASALSRKAYYFVPLTVSQGDETVIADRYDVALSDNAVCHRNLNLGDAQCVFISTRLMDVKFSVAFEFYINVGHAFVERAGVSQEFSDLVWKQVEAGARGETSLDAYDFRRQALVRGDAESDSSVSTRSAAAKKSAAANSAAPKVIDEKAKTNYLTAAFSDAVAIYLLSLYIDVDYYDLREREYPLLAPQALAERLRKIADLFPA